MMITEDMIADLEATFPKPEDMGLRAWGVETMLCTIPGVLTFKKLELNAGQKGGLQYHRKKDECGIVLSGEMIVRTISNDHQIEERLVQAGDVFHFSPGVVHQEEAVTDCVIIEASSPFINDRVRVEELFGLVAGQGLPSTKPGEEIAV
ncbi:cupin domain-containing protein [Actibacterium sp. 188UL27-1]|uniref:cupin domain-containing protein n=1 Tax=Actibacterium sp. 188UL27-1 TaxID=2786961 RepID=UPI00195B595E|nr:cupin domain-containing protein [Actibacterium sp. 188UL27-1]MBM7070042.1 cupin domain-containing protein [Actibacterium sp. 188UL27-1]